MYVLWSSTQTQNRTRRFIRELTISLVFLLRLPSKVDGIFYVGRAKDVVSALLVTTWQVIDGIGGTPFDLFERSWGWNYTAYEERRGGEDVFHVDVDLAMMTGFEKAFAENLESAFLMMLMSFRATVLGAIAVDLYISLQLPLSHKGSAIIPWQLYWSWADTKGFFASIILFGKN